MPGCSTSFDNLSDVELRTVGARGAADVGRATPAILGFAVTGCRIEKVQALVDAVELGSRKGVRLTQGVDPIALLQNDQGQPLIVDLLQLLFDFVDADFRTACDCQLLFRQFRSGQLLDLRFTLEVLQLVDQSVDQVELAKGEGNNVGVDPLVVLLELCLFFA